MFGWKVFNVVNGRIYSPVMNMEGEEGYSLGVEYKAQMPEVHINSKGKERVGGKKSINGIGTGTDGTGSTLELAPFFGFHIYPMEFKPNAVQFLNDEGFMPECKHLFLVEFNDSCYGDVPIKVGKSYIPNGGYYKRKANGQGVPWYYITGEMRVVAQIPDEAWFKMCPDIRKDV